MQDEALPPLVQPSIWVVILKVLGMLRRAKVSVYLFCFLDVPAAAVQGQAIQPGGRQVSGVLCRVSLGWPHGA